MPFVQQFANATEGWPIATAEELSVALTVTHWLRVAVQRWFKQCRRHVSKTFYLEWILGRRAVVRYPGGRADLDATSIVAGFLPHLTYRTEEASSRPRPRPFGQEESRHRGSPSARPWPSRRCSTAAPGADVDPGVAGARLGVVPERRNAARQAWQTSPATPSTHQEDLLTLPAPIVDPQSLLEADPFGLASPHRSGFDRASRWSTSRSSALRSARPKSRRRVSRAASAGS